MLQAIKTNYKNRTISKIIFALIFLTATWAILFPITNYEVSKGGSYNSWIKWVLLKERAYLPIKWSLPNYKFIHMAIAALLALFTIPTLFGMTTENASRNLPPQNLRPMIPSEMIWGAPLVVMFASWLGANIYGIAGALTATMLFGLISLLPNAEKNKKSHAGLFWMIYVFGMTGCMCSKNVGAIAGLVALGTTGLIAFSLIHQPEQR